MPVTTIQWRDNKVVLIDQTRLPLELVYIETDELEVLAEAIRNLRVRGAPAIGVAAAFGVVLGIQKHNDDDKPGFFARLNDTIALLGGTRPTAVNLSWALVRMRKVAESNREHSVPALKQKLLREAMGIFEEDRRICRMMGKHGDTLVPAKATVITHCNAGALATADFGTALGVLFEAHRQKKQLNVFVDETRPLLQGARLNMWELMREGIACTLICDSTAAFVMQRQPVDFCIVGADRIARNGDTANKIGTYSLAVNAQAHGIPFYVAAPISTIDFALATGAEIPIEERAAAEVTNGFGRQTAPAEAKVFSPAFDVTPAALIAAIITEAGVIRPPYEQNLSRLRPDERVPA